jgi:anti-anti-sigma regulatory factor
MTTNIYIEQSSNLALRATASTTVSELVKSGHSEVFYDLAKVEVMSRAFADQLFKEIAMAADKGIRIQLVNMCQQAKEVMHAVSMTQHNLPKKPVQYQELNFTFDTMDEFYKLFDGESNLA